VWQARAINSVTINSTVYVPGQSSYNRPTAGNGLYVIFGDDNLLNDTLQSNNNGCNQLINGNQL